MFGRVDHGMWNSPLGFVDNMETVCIQTLLPDFGTVPEHCKTGRALPSLEVASTSLAAFFINCEFPVVLLILVSSLGCQFFQPMVPGFPNSTFSQIGTHHAPNI